MAKDKIESAEDYIANKRGLTNSNQEQKEAYIKSIQTSWANLGFGVEQIQIGDLEINIKNPIMNYAHPDETYFSEEMKKGKTLYVLNTNIDNIGFRGKNTVLFSHQPLNSLIDVSLIQSLAPHAKIYSYDELKPWGNIFTTESYSIYITEEKEALALWENLPQWAYIEWFDNIMKKSSSGHEAKHTIYIDLTRLKNPHFSDAIAAYEKAKKEYEEIYNLGDWNSAAQTSLKHAISELIHIEEHPLFGNHIQQIIEQLSPLLEQSMKGKSVLDASRKKKNKLREAQYKKYQHDSIMFDKWTPEFPKKS